MKLMLRKIGVPIAVSAIIIGFILLGLMLFQRYHLLLLHELHNGKIVKISKEYKWEVSQGVFFTVVAPDGSLVVPRTYIGGCEGACEELSFRVVVSSDEQVMGILEHSQPNVLRCVLNFTESRVWTPADVTGVEHDELLRGSVGHLSDQLGVSLIFVVDAEYSAKARLQ